MENTEKKFWERLEETRQDADETQAQIAKTLGITQPQYQLYESGKREIKIEKLIKFCNHYGVSADYILGLPKGLEWPR